MLDLIKEKIANYPVLKRIILFVVFSRQWQFRWLVRWFVNPIVHTKGKRSRVGRKSRIDCWPQNKFTLGNDSIIEDYAIVNNAAGDIVIGDRTLVGISDILIGPVTIGSDVMIAQHVVIAGFDHDYRDVTLPPSKQQYRVARVVIDDEAWIGANSVILAGITVGKHSVVAAGSVVTDSVPPYCVVAGNPAEIIKRYDFDNRIWARIQSD